jgi:hypothetical protein
VKKQNMIVQWEGGGYDGCFWEPNTGIYDSVGTWVPIISTGRGARPNPVREEDDLEFPFTKEGMLEFRENIRDDFAMHTLRAMEELGIKIWWECDVCEQVFDHSEDFSEYEGYQGDGGIGIIEEGLVCTECRDEGSCSHCREYYGKDILNRGVCGTCMDEALNKNPDIQGRIQQLDEDAERVKQVARQYAKIVPRYAIKAYRWVHDFRVSAESEKRDLEEELVEELVG